MNSLSGLLCRFKPLSILQHGSGVRFLYSSASIGLEDYILARGRHLRKPDLDPVKFRKKMAETCNSDDINNLIFTDDLKMMIHIGEPVEEDISLIEKMILKFHAQTSPLRFGSYVFGPVVMRMYHYMNKAEEAYNLYKNDKTNGFFDQLSSHVVLMDLLFKNEMYSEVLDVYKTLREKQMSFGKHPKSMMVLVFGAYYKLNTPEQYKEALAVFEEMKQAGHTPLRRAVCFLSALALRQNDPSTSIEIISTLTNQKYFLVRCIKALALCEVNRHEDAVSVLKSVLHFDAPVTIKHTFPRDVIQKVQESVNNSKNKELILEFKRISDQLRSQDHVIEKTFDELLCSEVTVMAAINKTQTALNAAIDQSDNRKKFRPYQRPGLQEII